MYREILTKAVIAKGYKTLIDDKVIDTNQCVSKVLGCWIINHKFTPYINKQNIFIKGSYQANIWYGIDNNTSSVLKVIDIQFEDELPYNFTLEKISLSSKNELICEEKTPINCNKMAFENNNINLSIERSYQIDIIGESKIKVKVDDVIIDQMINTDYMKNKNE